MNQTISSSKIRDETAKKIGKYVASLIEDESTIQMGIVYEIFTIITKRILKFFILERINALHDSIINRSSLRRYNKWIISFNNSLFTQLLNYII